VFLHALVWVSADWNNAKAADVQGNNAKAADVQETDCSDPDCIELGTEFIPYAVVRDNYGRFVADRYFAVDVAVVNKHAQNSTLYINAFVFDLLSSTNAQPLLNVDPKLVRGSIEKGQLVGRRNVSIEILKGLGATASGLSGFFKAAQSAATAGRIIAAFNGPAITGIGAVIPDTTVKYLNNWDQDQVFKNGFVVPAGQTQRGRVFLPIQSLFPDFQRNDSQHKTAKDFRIDDIEAKIKDIHVLGFSAQSVTNIKNSDSKRIPSTTPSK